MAGLEDFYQKRTEQEFSPMHHHHPRQRVPLLVEQPSAQLVQKRIDPEQQHGEGAAADSTDHYANLGK